MTDIPEAAVESAAIAAYKASPDWTPHDGDTIPNSWHQDEYRREAKDVYVDIVPDTTAFEAEIRRIPAISPYRVPKVLEADDPTPEEAFREGIGG